MKYNSGFSGKSKISLGKSKIFRILAIAIILALLMVAIPATPVLAATITLYPTEGSPGTTVTVNGVGFIANQLVEIDFNWVPKATVQTTALGAFSTFFTVPDVAGGTYYVQVFDYLAPTTVLATAPFTVTGVAEIEIDPEEGPVDTEVEISGEGFDDREDIVIEYDGDEVDIESGDDRTDSDGEFEDTIIIIPPSTAGDHTITVTGDDSDTEAEAEFTVESKITISPEEGSSGDEVTVTGTGFDYKSDVTIYFDDEPVEEERTDRDGSFEATFTVPALALDTYDVEAEDEDDNTDTVEFDIATTTSVSFAPVTSLDLPGHVGMELTISGTGFIANHQVTITYLSEPIIVATTTADASGAFSATFDVPVSTGGTHTITATDGTNTEQDTFIMESTPPSPVYPLLPALGSKLKAWKFDWCGDATDPGKEVTDDSLPVTYTLEVATDAGFANVVLKKEGLTTSVYTVTGEEKELLPSTKKEAPYYWRVKAIDGASNETDWATAWTFYVGFAFAMPQWLIYTLFGVGALLLGLLGFWLGRRTAYSYF